MIAYDVGFNREVLDDEGCFFSGADDIGPLFHLTESSPASVAAQGRANRVRAATAFRWDDVATAYADLARRLARGDSIRHETPRRRRREEEWVG